MRGEDGRLKPIVAAYDAAASVYDAHMAPAAWIRARLWERMRCLFPPGSKVLDVAAGTGIDSVYLHSLGVQVVAVDIAQGMLTEISRKLPAVETHTADFNDLPRALGKSQYDGVISTFAGLNTTADLGPFARGVAGLLAPGGILFVHCLNRWPALDIARGAAHGRNWRQLGLFGERAAKIGETLVTHFPLSPAGSYRRWFAGFFDLERIEGYGVVRPVGARWGGSLDGLDRWAGRYFPFNRLGTFFSLEMRRRTG